MAGPACAPGSGDEASPGTLCDEGVAATLADAPSALFRLSSNLMLHLNPHARSVVKNKLQRVQHGPRKILDRLLALFFACGEVLDGGGFFPGIGEAAEK